jgi:hypothetical protein
VWLRTRYPTIIGRVGMKDRIFPKFLGDKKNGKQIILKSFELRTPVIEIGFDKLWWSLGW